MQIHVLGSAAGGGVPQWNCGCANCEGARTGRLSHRTQSSLAASVDGVDWILFNATTDVRAQIERTPFLHPTVRRGFPIAAVFLTDANIDHTAGLLDFRQAGALRVISTPTVRDVLLSNPMFVPFASPPRSWDVCGASPVSVCGMRVSAIPVPGLLPGYAGAKRVDGAATAFAIDDGAGTCVVYAPVYLEVDAALQLALADASAAFLDGSFWTDDEMPAAGLGSRTARQMGHAPMSGPGGTLEALAGGGLRSRYFTHINNTNPVLDPSSAAAVRVASEGYLLASDGLTLQLSGEDRGAGLRA